MEGGCSRRGACPCDGFAETAYVENGPVSVAPEPSTWAMLLVGFGSLGLLSYRTGRSKAAFAV